MKVIDLLNKVAKGEKVPKVIKYNDYNFRHIDNYCYVNKEGELLSTYIYVEESRLNDEIEIIEDTPKEIDNLYHVTIYGQTISSLRGELQATNRRFEDKLNEIIDRLNGE